MKRIISKIGFFIIFSALLGCATIAQWVAPEKKDYLPDPEAFGKIEAEFWTAFHNGEYDKITNLISKYQEFYIKNPRNARAAVRLGFLHVWRLSEWQRADKLRPDFIDHATLCKTYLHEAVEMIPDDPRFFGFYAACQMAEADIHQNEKNLRKGYFDMLQAVRAWPQFNAFTAGYVLSKLPHTHERYDEGVEFQWTVLDECVGEKVDRDNLDYRKYMKNPDLTGPNRVCDNSAIAPHNFEGFFLNMGDMIVKQGNVKQAKMIYRQATYHKDYAQWPFKKVLEKRIEDAEKNVAFFRKEVTPPVKPAWPVIMFQSELACGGCHRSK